MAELLEKAPVLGAYAVTHELRRDGLGILYRGQRHADSRPVLIRAIAAEISSNDNFIVRFELLKTLLPKIVHKNLLQVLELATDGQLYFLVKEWPSEDPERKPMTLENFDPRDTPNRHRAWEALFEGIARGLYALEQVRDDYYRHGLVHDSIEPQRIFLDFEKSLVGSSMRPIPKLDGFAESFLFFGEQSDARLRYRMATPSYRWNELQEEPALFANEHLYPDTSRRDEEPKVSWMMYQLGALIHQMIAGVKVKGDFPALLDSDATIDPIWDAIADLCLSALYQPGPGSLEPVIDLFNDLNKKRTQLTAGERKLRRVDVPSGMALVAVQEKVVLGADDGPKVEQPAFKARLRPFLIDVAPVTIEQFSKFLKTYQPSSYSRQPNSPATLVSWHAARAYCRWRSEQEGLPLDTYRLPTEYEWEAAVRGSSGQQYAWGSSYQAERLLCGLDPEHGAVPVKSKAPGRFGLYDMLGNVWEWTQSVFKPHPFHKGDRKLFNPKLYVAKGGCWFSEPETVRASLRAAFAPNERRGNIGFRCVRAIQIDEHDEVSTTQETE